MKRAAAYFGPFVCLCSGAIAFAATPESVMPIGSIGFFGLRKVSEATLRQHLPIKEGDLVNVRQKPDGAPIAKAVGVDQVTLAYVCCTPDQKLMVYVGVAEKPVRLVQTSPSFSGTARLPDGMIRAAEDIDSQLQEAIGRGQADEDDSQGHALGTYPPLRAAQQKFIDYAREHSAQVAEVLATSADARHRAIAAEILGYAPDKRAAAAALARAAADPSDGVRNNATRALGIIARYSLTHPELGIRIDPKPFVQLLNSVVWTDLNKGLSVLDPLTAGREPGLLKYVGKHARRTLIDMCRWKTGHADEACLVLRRVEGLPDFSGIDVRSDVLRKVDGESPR